MALHSIFGAAAPPGTTTSHTDAGSGAWLAQQFYATASAAVWTITAVRLWVPAGSVLIGRTGKVSALARNGYFLYATAYPNTFLTAPTYRAFTEPLVAGWNERPLAVPLSLPVGTGVIAGYNIGNGYLFNNGLSTDSIRASDGSNLYLCEIGITGQPGRSWYSDAPAQNLTSQPATFYGIDIVADDGQSVAVPTGSFSGTYGYGPASAAGAAPVSGTFNSTYGWRPASAEGRATASGGFGTSSYTFGPADAGGVAPPVGTFASQYGWGAAVASGAVAAGGGFTGQYGWRPAASAGMRPSEAAFGLTTYGWGPATFDGLVPPLGVFSGGYRFGPAVAMGEAAVGGIFVGSYGWGPAGFIGPYVPAEFCWPDCMSLVAEEPRFTLSEEGPCLTMIEEDAC